MLKLDFFYDAVCSSQIQNLTGRNMIARMKEGGQADAHELLGILINSLHDEMIYYSTKRKDSSSPITSIFGGEYISTISSQSIKDSITTQSFTQLNLPINVHTSFIY